MLIQDAGKQILSKNPGKIYIFCGDDYGIKNKYIRILKSIYKVSIECDTVDDVLKRSKTKSLLPEPQKLYIVRYDDGFLNSLNDDSIAELSNVSIHGTLVCIYQSDKATAKCMKYLSDFAVEINRVNKNLVYKYILSDFPDLPELILQTVATYTYDYSTAYHVCACISKCSMISQFDSDNIQQIFHCQNETDDLELRTAIASRNFRYIMQLIDTYPGDLNQVFYMMLSTMLELDKLHKNKFYKSPYRKYADRWTDLDIYNMFTSVYYKLSDLRTDNINVYDTLVYLIALTQFGHIPDSNLFSCEV